MRHKIKSSGHVHDWNMAINEHLIEVNSRGGWGLSSPPSAWDRWFPWALAVMTLAVVIMGWIRGWM
jgi:hypothetical protein